MPLFSIIEKGKTYTKIYNKVDGTRQLLNSITKMTGGNNTDDSDIKLKTPEEYQKLVDRLVKNITEIVGKECDVRELAKIALADKKRIKEHLLNVTHFKENLTNALHIAEIRLASLHPDKVNEYLKIRNNISEEKDLELGGFEKGKPLLNKTRIELETYINDVEKEVSKISKNIIKNNADDSNKPVLERKL